MKVIIAATPAAGHVDPVLGIARVLVNRGHEVHVCTGRRFHARVTSVGARFIPLPASADFDGQDADREFPGRAGLTGLDALLFDFEHIFFGKMRVQYEGLLALIDTVRPDAIIADMLFFGIVPLMLLPRDSRPLIGICGITFLGLPRDDGMPHGPAIPVLGADRSAAPPLAMLEGARAAMMPLQTMYEARLRDFGIEPVGTALDVTTSHADIFWQGGVPALEYPRESLPEHVNFVGRWPQSPATAALPDWGDELRDGRNIVFVTQGTVANGDLDTLVLPTMRALAHRNDLLVVATTGGRDPGDLARKLPSNARIATYLPLDWLLPRVHAMVTNGGFGTVIQALAAGVPLVVAGATEDKPEIAARVARSGAGIDLKSENPGETALCQAVENVLDQPHYRAAARQLADAFSCHDAETIIETGLMRGLSAHPFADGEDVMAAA